MSVMGSLGSDVAQTYTYLTMCCMQRHTLGRTLSSRHVSLQPLSPSLNIFLRPYLSICRFLISIDTRGVDKSPQWGPGTRGDLG